MTITGDDAWTNIRMHIALIARTLRLSSRTKVKVGRKEKGRKRGKRLRGERMGNEGDAVHDNSTVRDLTQWLASPVGRIPRKGLEGRGELESKVDKRRKVTRFW